MFFICYVSRHILIDQSAQLNAPTTQGLTTAATLVITMTAEDHVEEEVAMITVEEEGMKGTGTMTEVIVAATVNVAVATVTAATVGTGTKRGGTKELDPTCEVGLLPELQN